jgi:hypothetical protein
MGLCETPNSKGGQVKNTIKLSRRQLRKAFREHFVHWGNSKHPNDKTIWLSTLERSLFGQTTLATTKGGSK